MCQVTGVPRFLAGSARVSGRVPFPRRRCLPGRGTRSRPLASRGRCGGRRRGRSSGRRGGGDRLCGALFRASAGHCRPCVPMSAPGPGRGPCGRSAPALYSAENTHAFGRLPAPYERRGLQMMAEVRLTRMVSPMGRAASPSRRCGGVPVRAPPAKRGGIPGRPSERCGGSSGRCGGVPGGRAREPRLVRPGPLRGFRPGAAGAQQPFSAVWSAVFSAESTLRL